MTNPLDELVLDDPNAITAADPGEMLPQVASSGRQVRESAALTAETGLASVAADGRPRAVVVLGVGGSGIVGDVLAAVAGPSCPIPILSHKGYGLPGWVGVADLVIAVSCSGTTEETLSGFDEAARRGANLMAVGAPDSPLAYLAESNRATFVAIPPEGRSARTSMWALSIPVLLAGRELGIMNLPPEVVEATAARLEEVATRCRPSSDAFVNPAKTLALELAGALPMVWGTSPTMGVAAARAAHQLARNAKYPAIAGVLPEANHHQMVAFDGVFGTRAAGYPDDFFRDRADEPDVTRLRVVLLRDEVDAEHPQVTRRAEASLEIAAERGVAVTQLRPEGRSSLERFASLVGLVDYASVYLAIALGIDPTPSASARELEIRLESA
jgi:glucose/mannose-6-phosphate isomerase